MALIETKVLQLENDQNVITETSNVMGSFGWTVLSVQVSHSQNSKDLGDRVQTTTINYATMTLQRDKHMPNYAEIARLEEEYYQCAAKAEQYKKARGKAENHSKLGIFLFLALLLIVPRLLPALGYALDDVIGVTATNILVSWLLSGLVLIVIVYSVLRAILKLIATKSDNPSIMRFLEKYPIGVLEFGKEKALKDMDDYQHEAAQAALRMAEIRQQAEALIP